MANIDYKQIITIREQLKFCRDCKHFTFSPLEEMLPYAFNNTGTTDEASLHYALSHEGYDAVHCLCHAYTWYQEFLLGRRTCRRKEVKR